ncbi:hypothetical protein MRX96_051878 [Rhipicephalus microplus]
MSLHLIRAQEISLGERPSPDRTRTFPGCRPSLCVSIQWRGRSQRRWLAPSRRPTCGASQSTGEWLRGGELVNLSVSAAGNLFAALRWLCACARTAHHQLDGGLQRPLPSAVSRAALIYARAHTPNASFSRLPNGRLVPGRNAGLRTGTRLP